MILFGHADNLLDQCLGEKIPTFVQNDLLPIEYTSGYLMVFITAFLSKLSLSFQNLVTSLIQQK